MRQLIRVAFLGIGILLIPAPASAAEVSVTEILERGADLAGEEITVDGELVGDYGFRSDGSTWAQLNGDIYVHRPLREGNPPFGANNGIAIRIPVRPTSALDPPGGYRNRGPVVRVTGIWVYHDSTRPGESYLDVQSLTITQPGRQFDEEINVIPIIIGTLLLAGAGAIAWVTRPED